MRIERADKRYQPLHLLWLVIEPAVYLRVADKPPAPLGKASQNQQG